MARFPTEALTAIRRRLARWAGAAKPAELAGLQILRAFADTYPRAVFIEIGANDGVQHDHLRPFLVSLPWRGVMVEPVPREQVSAHVEGLGYETRNEALDTWCHDPQVDDSLARCWLDARQSR